MKRDFNTWLKSFKSSISNYTYYTDFPKVVNNVSKLKVELNILNSLIGSKNIIQDFLNIVNRYPETLRCIPILLAVRQLEIETTDTDGIFLYNFDKPNYTIDQYVVFMQRTGLFDLLEHHLINNLVDYVLGVEVGLDSNGRKNRGGTLMTNLVELNLKKLYIEYYREMNISKITAKWNIDLSILSNEGKSEKRFDFVVYANNTVYAIETNFYASGGSKLNETARSYKLIALESRAIPNFEFVWFTDGNGWISARNNLQDTFDSMQHIYNIDEINNGIMRKIFL
jgi:type II restriction enzyme